MVFPTCAFRLDGDSLVMSALDKKLSNSSNTYSIELGELPHGDHDFKFFFKVENLKMITADYDVSIAKQVVSHFTHKTSGVSIGLPLSRTRYTMDEFLWVEKYRPKKIDDCILPASIKSTFKQMVDSGETQNLLLCGGPGCGKTTVAALCHEMDSEFMMINCSEDGNIDTLRTTIRNFASTVSMSGGKKVVILDEFDYSNPQSTQPALRGFIEEFSKNCRFILTCNYKNRIIEPLHSRCTVVEFKIPIDQRPQIAAQTYERVTKILTQEDVPFEDKVIAKLIMKHFPTFAEF